MKAGFLLFFLSIATPVFSSEIETGLMVSIDGHPLPPGVFLITEL